MSDKKLKSSLMATREALSKLRESLDALKGSKKSSQHAIFEDAAIKRFEVLFEYVWKLLKAATEYQGGEAPGPRPAIQEGARFGWIDDVEFWADALDARNGSVHDYFGIPRERYLKIVRRFADEADAVIGKIESLSPTRQKY